MSQQEQWCEVEEFPAYEVSSLGRFRRKDPGQGARAGAFLKWHTCTSTGYPSIRFRAMGRQYTRVVHVVVARAFHGPRPDGLETRHLDGNKLNAAAANLQYGTRAENGQDRVLHGSMPSGELHHKAKVTDIEVEAIRAALSSGENAKAVALRYGLSFSTVYRIKSGEIRKKGATR